MSLNKNVIGWIEEICEEVEKLKNTRKEVKKEFGDVRLEIGLLKSQIETEISLLKLEELEINYPYFIAQTKRVNAEQKFLESQLRGVRNELSELEQHLVSLECNFEIAKTTYD